MECWDCLPCGIISKYNVQGSFLLLGKFWSRVSRVVEMHLHFTLIYQNFMRFFFAMKYRSVCKRKETNQPQGMHVTGEAGRRPPRPRIPCEAIWLRTRPWIAMMNNPRCYTVTLAMDRHDELMNNPRCYTLMYDFWRVSNQMILVEWLTLTRFGTIPPLVIDIRPTFRFRTNYQYGMPSFRSEIVCQTCIPHSWVLLHLTVHFIVSSYSTLALLNTKSSTGSLYLYGSSVLVECCHVFAQDSLHVCVYKYKLPCFCPMVIPTKTRCSFSFPLDLTPRCVRFLAHELE